VYGASVNARPFLIPFLVYHFLLLIVLFLCAFFILFTVRPVENKAYAAILFAAALVVAIALELVNLLLQ
jgi:hypothetical protein